VSYFIFVPGVLIYEMLSGFPPFFDENAFGIYEKILSGKIEWPRHMDPISKDLVKKLLVQDRTKRLGNMKVMRRRIKSVLAVSKMLIYFAFFFAILKEWS
jgi:serine/threonine protein kinase